MRPSRFTVAGPGGRLTGWTAGTGRLPLLLLHGVNGAADDWLPIAEILAPARRLIAFDLRAHGGSERAAGYRAEDYAADAAAVLDACDVAEAHVAGTSFGGAVALALAAARPERVRTVAAVGTSARGDQAALEPIEKRISELGVRGFFAWALPTFGYRGGTDEAVIEAAVERAAANDAATVLAILREAFGADVLAIAAAVGTGHAALVATGEHDQTCPPPSVRPLAEALGVPLTVLPGAGHLAITERPAEIAALLENHARAHEAVALPVTPGRTVAELVELRTLTGDANGAQRVCWTETWRSARDWFTARLRAIPGVQVERDAAGNLWASLPGRSPRAVIIGSHLDSVPDGGWLDGCYGVLAGLELLRACAAAEDTLPVTVRLVDWADEEGVRFGRSLYGSAAATGSLDVGALRGLRDAEGHDAASVLARYGVHLDEVSAAGADDRVRQAAAYLELHIEQGPVLERAGLSLAAVSGTLGVRRHRLRLSGQSAHAGATPLAVRRDPLAAAARVVLTARELATAAAGLATCGSITAAPGVVTAVPREVELTLDLRHGDDDALAELDRSCAAAAGRIAESEGVEISSQPLLGITPARFAEELVELAADTVADLSGARHIMPSGPLHDAAEMARAGVPTAMIFAQSSGGLSHTREEDSRADHLELGVRALADLTQLVITRIAGGLIP